MTAATGAAIARVALDTPAGELFDYRIPDAMLDMVQPGRLVTVPFGRRLVPGLVTALADTTDVPSDKLRELAAVCDSIPPLDHAWLALGRFAASYYHRPLGEVLLPALPPMLRDPASWPRLAQRSHVLVYRLREGRAADLLAALPPRSPGVRRLADALLAQDGEGSLDERTAIALYAQARARLEAWCAAGWVVREQRAAALLDIRSSEVSSPPLLHAEQRVAVDAITSSSGFAPMLLHGVTGSGKTEVYLHAMAEVLARDPAAQVLMLVPEINLTPQLEARIAARFPHLPLATLHSGLAEQVRAMHWLAAHRGEARIVLGTRLAILASLPHLALVLVDEEHDTSYKQQEGLRYSARDLAVWRAKQRGIPVVLGSATPSLETWWRARQETYRTLTLRERAQADAVLPRIGLIDLNLERQRQRPLQDGLSVPLIEAMRQRLARGEQTLLFLNRRGYAPVLSCAACGWLSGCPRCSAYLVMHKPERRLRCHHCGWEERIPHHCPDCGNIDIAALGHGTQRLEERLVALFPEARIARIDADSTRRKGSAEVLFEEVHAGQVDILIGTQMVAKGHDFQRVTLVGVVNPDQALFSHDFRAAEHLFAALMQVAGRAGRAGLPGEVLIQTRYSEASAFQALLRHDYEGFADAQLTERQQAGLPPFSYQALLTAEHRELAGALAFLRAVREEALALAGDAVQVLDPVPMSMVRIANRERAQMLVESTSRTVLQRLLVAWMPACEGLPQRQGVRWQLEIDPLRI